MFAQFILLLSLLLHPERRLVPKKYKYLYAFGEKDRRIEICQRYFCNIKSVRSIDEIKWLDILSRRIRVISIPDKSYISKTNQKIKRLLLKILMLNVSAELNIINIQEYFIGRQEPKIVFLIEQITAALVQYHLPAFKVKLIKGEAKLFRLYLIYFVLYVNKSKLMDYADGVTIFACYPNEWLIKIYRMLHPNRQIVLRLHNRVDNHVKLRRRIESMLKKHVIDVAESYYRKDSELLNVNYRPNGVNAKKLIKEDQNIRKSLYFFLGARSKGNTRMCDLLPVEKKVKEIYPNILQWIDLYSPVGTSEWIPYCQYLEKAISTEVFIDLVRISQDEGFSYRIPEALALNRKIITNRRNLIQEPFYSKDRIFILGVDSLDGLQAFLENDIPKLDDSILSYFNSELWWSEHDPYLRKDPNYR